MDVVPPGAAVIPLVRKLSELGGAAAPDDWSGDAAWTLRGGDGGEHGLLLYKLISRFSGRQRPVVALDVGTARGFSAIAMARAMIDAGLNGRVHTVDVIGHDERLNWHAHKHRAGEPLDGTEMSRSEIWRRWFAEESTRVSPIVGRSTEVLADWDGGPIDIAFLDGSHYYDDMKSDLVMLDSLMAPNGTIVVDDYHLGLSVARLPSRAINSASRRLRRALGGRWPRMRERLSRLGQNSEYSLVTHRFHGIRRAVAEFLDERPGRWSLEIVPMPSRGGYQGSDYSLAVLELDP